jgi:hypothetical protein
MLIATRVATAEKSDRSDSERRSRAAEIRLATHTCTTINRVHHDTEQHVRDSTEWLADTPDWSFSIDLSNGAEGVESDAGYL